MGGRIIQPFSSHDAAIDDVAEADGVGEREREATQLCETDPASETNESASRETSGLSAAPTGGGPKFLDLERD